MSASTSSLHLHLEKGFSGSIVVRPGPDPDSVEVEFIDKSDHDPLEGQIEAMLERFSRYDGNTEARAVYGGLVSAGWTAVLPKTRRTKTVSEPYIRFTYDGSVHRPRLYVNSASAEVSGEEAAVFAETLPQAIRKGGVFVYHKGGHAADVLTVANALRRWADGEPVPER